MIGSSAWSHLPDHWALLPLDNSYRTINILKAFISAIHAVWSLWSCIYHEFKEILRKISLSHFALFPCLFTLGLNGRSIYELLFFVARAGFHVAVLVASEFRWEIFPSEDFRHLLNGTLSCAYRSLSVACLRNWSRFTYSKHCLTDDE